MASIPGKNASAFKEAANPVLDFTDSELMQIDALASQLRAIIQDAKEREQERFKKVR